MKRIILTVTTDLTYDQRMQRIASSLHQAGYSVLLVGRKKRNSVPLDARPFKQHRIHCWFQGGKFFYLEYNVRLFFFLLFHRADLLNAIDLDSILPVTIVGWLRRKKRVYDAHEYFTEVPEVVRRPKIQAVWERVARFCIPKMDACYTVGPMLAKIFQEKYGKHFGVVRNVPRVIPTPENQRGPEKIILYQGALNEGRGLEYIIEAMKKLPPECKLWLAGEGDLSVSLRQLVQEAGIEERVRFFGFVKPAALKQLTAQATIGLNLLENKGLSYYYSLANKAFDYVQAGVPSLQMQFPEYQALQAEFPCFVLIPDLSTESIIAGVQEILKERSYSKMEEACRQASAVWNWEKEEKRLLEVYRKLA